MPSSQPKILSRNNSGTPASLADSQKSNNDDTIADVETLDEEEYFGDSSDGDENESRKVC